MDPTILWTAVSIAFLMMLSAFFSGSETALTAARRGILHGMADRGSRGAATALRLREDSERLIGGILLGNNLVNILATSLTTSVMTAAFAESGVVVATALMTLLVLIFAEVMPKNYAITNPETAAARVSPIIDVFVRVLAPLVGAITGLVRIVLRLFGVRPDPDAHALAAREEIAGAISLGHSEGAVEKDDRDRLLAALDLSAREVSEVMMHRRNIETIDAEADPEEIVSFCLQSRYTRIPIWKDEPENIVGVIHAKDLLRAVDDLTRRSAEGRAGLADLDVMAVAMEPWFVPDTTSMDEQMREFLRRKSHFALVVDEYGDLQGLITLEDILEEIVGDIADEHDEAEEEIARAPDGSFEVDGATTIRDLNRWGDWTLPDEEATTIAGLVIHEAQTIPTVGQIFTFHGFRFEITGRERHQITRLRMKEAATAD